MVVGLALDSSRIMMYIPRILAGSASALECIIVSTVCCSLFSIGPATSTLAGRGNCLAELRCGWNWFSINGLTRLRPACYELGIAE